MALISVVTIATADPGSPRDREGRGVVLSRPSGEAVGFRGDHPFRRVSLSPGRFRGGPLSRDRDLRVFMGGVADFFQVWQDPRSSDESLLCGRRRGGDAGRSHRSARTVGPVRRLLVPGDRGDPGGDGPARGRGGPAVRAGGLGELADHRGGGDERRAGHLAPDPPAAGDLRGRGDLAEHPDGGGDGRDGPDAGGPAGGGPDGGGAGRRAGLDGPDRGGGRPRRSSARRRCRPWSLPGRWRVPWPCRS